MKGTKVTKTQAPLQAGFAVPGSWFFDLILGQVMGLVKNGDGKRREHMVRQIAPCAQTN
jgi:hypothetical protein